MQYTEEEKQCYNALTKQSKWVCFGNEMYKILTDYYLDIDDLLEPSKLFSNVSIER